MTPLQQAIRASDVRLTAECDQALTRCKSDYARDQCRKAYSDLIAKHHDMIGQQFGLSPMLYRKSDR